MCRITDWIIRMEPYIRVPVQGSPITSEERRRIWVMCKAGMNIQQIADWTCRTPGTVRRCLYDMEKPS